MTHPTKTVHDHHHDADGVGAVTAVLHVGNVHWGSEKAVVESFLQRLPGVTLVEANPVAQTATVTYDPSETSVAGLQAWIEDCGYHCAGQSVPGHVCMPMHEPGQEGQEATIVSEVMRAGYAWRGRVIRPAMVKVQG